MAVFQVSFLKFISAAVFTGTRIDFCKIHQTEKLLLNFLSAQRKKSFRFNPYDHLLSANGRCTGMDMPVARRLRLKKNIFSAQGL
jgi:uncharacterized OsmC-like protein